MVDERDDEKGRDPTFSEAHTRADPPIRPDVERAAKVGSTRATAEAALDDLARQLVAGDDEAEQADLLLDEDLPLFGGPVKHVAKTMEAAKGRGRRHGSKNKANQLFRDTLMRMGFRHPGLNLAALANADPLELAAELSERRYDEKREAWVIVGCTPAEAMKLIKDANAELLPYFESKRPTEQNVNVRQLGVMLVGNLDAPAPGDDDVIDVTAVPAPDEAKSST